MKIQQKILAVVLIILLNLGVLGATSAETLTYKAARSGKESFRKAKIEKTGKSYVITLTDSLNDTQNTFETDQSLSLLKWRSERSEEGTDITAVREGNRISITGMFKNEDYEKEFRINDSPWYQDWGLGLRFFINSDNDTTRFWSMTTLKMAR